MYFYEFSDRQENAKQNDKNEKTKQEIKEGVRGTYLLATMGGKCWIHSYAAGTIDGVCVGNAGSTGAAGAVEGSTGSTGAARVEGDTDLDGAAVGFAVNVTVASSSIPQMN